ncbi:MAG: hypothetical protein AMXMBFR23_21590 [Chloroflexota bacterium]
MTGDRWTESATGAGSALGGTGAVEVGEGVAVVVALPVAVGVASVVPVGVPVVVAVAVVVAADDGDASGGDSSPPHATASSPATSAGRIRRRTGMARPFGLGSAFRLPAGVRA